MGFKIIAPLVGYTDSNVNLKTTGATVVFTNPSTSNLYFPVKVRVYGTNLTGLVTPPTLSVGTNASSFNNILPATATTGLVNGTYIDYVVTFPVTPLTAGTSISVNVTVGANATTYGARIAVFMDYF